MGIAGSGVGDKVFDVGGVLGGASGCGDCSGVGVGDGGMLGCGNCIGVGVDGGGIL